MMFKKSTLIEDNFKAVKLRFYIKVRGFNFLEIKKTKSSLVYWKNIKVILKLYSK